MSTLFVTPFTPALGSGRAVRTYGLVRALAVLGAVDLVYVPFDGTQPAPGLCDLPGLTFHQVRPSRGLRRLFRYARLRGAGVPDGFARGASPELCDAAEALATAPERGRVIADSPVAAASLLSLARRRPVIYNAHNLESAFRHDLDLGRRGLGGRRGLEAFERRLLETAAEAWMVSHADVAGARSLAPAASVRYVPNVVDVQAIRPVVKRPGDGRVIFVADFTYEPNRLGLRFLVDEVLPRVWRRRPETRLLIVGRGLEEAPREDARVERAGFVEDLGAAYASADCAVVPLLHGGGSPLKFVEALAYGLPVVATPRAARGLEVRPGVHYLEGEGADDFAAALLRGLDQDAAAAGRRGRALVEKAYSIEALVDLIRPG